MVCNIYVLYAIGQEILYYAQVHLETQKKEHMKKVAETPVQVDAGMTFT